MNYDPLIEPDPRQWLAMDENRRLQMVLDYHRRARLDIPNQRLHAAVHTVVENQAALGAKTPVAETLQRLMQEGLDRHEAIHAVGSVLAGHIWKWLTNPASESLDVNRLFSEVRQLTAQKWLDEYGNV